MDEQTKRSFNTGALRAYVMVGVLAALWLYFHWATGTTFLTARNLSNLMTQMSVTAIIAVGMLMVIVSGNIDLSAGSVLGFAGGVAAYMMTTHAFGMPVAIVTAILIGVLVGLLHGSLVA